MPQQTTATGLSQQPASIESACEINKGRIGFNPQGYRGLIAASDIAPGDVVLSIPLHNMLQVPRQLTEVHMHTAAAAALDAWQQQHGQLPPQLLAFLLDSGVIWEAKLVGWLLYLKAAAPQGSLWHSYCQSLPAEAQALTFCSYSEQHAEQLQFSIWKVSEGLCAAAALWGMQCSKQASQSMWLLWGCGEGLYAQVA